MIHDAHGAIALHRYNWQSHQKILGQLQRVNHRVIRFVTIMLFYILLRIDCMAFHT